jgi:DNA-binding response OmpR family regulator
MDVMHTRRYSRFVPPHTTKVLLVEDDPDFRAQIVDAFRGRAIDVSVAETAQEAADLLKGDGFTAVLLDLVLRDGDGLAVLQHIRNAGHDLPVIVITGYLTNYISELANFFTQVRLIVTKPYPADQLVANVAAVGAA